MHKKPFIAVLALGLLLIATTTFAAANPKSESPVRSFGNGQSKSGLSPTPEANPGSLVSINAGTNRTVPGTFCNGNWQGAYAYSVGGWYVGNEFYAAYQDPSNATWWNGTCTNSPSFDVTAINTINRFSAGPFPMTFVFQPLVYGVSSTAECAIAPAPVAGGALCTGPLYAVTWTAAASFLINLPFPLECCQTGPFFAAWYGPTPGALRIGCNAGSPVDLGGPSCGAFNEYGAGWDELSKYFTWPSPGPYNLEHELYAEGYTPDDPATHCTPGNCGTEYWYDPSVDADFAFGLPSGSGGGRDRLGEWVEANGLDTIRAVNFAMNGGSPADKADLYLEIYAANFAGSACSGRMPGVADVPLYSEVIPEAAWTPGAWASWTLATPFVWGTLNGGPTQRVVVALGRVEGTGTTTGLLANNDDGACGPADHFVGRYPVIGEWLNIYDVSGIAPEMFMELDICREQLPAIEEACSTPGADSWRHFAHDNQQTSSSNINVTDPNGAVLRWSKSVPLNSNFTNPTVAGDIVYTSSDQQVTAYNLITGALVGTFNGGPEMGSSNRGNTTVAYVSALGRDVVFATGGSLNAITALETNLETSAKIWSFNVVTHPPNGLGGTSLGAGLVRFNTSTVLNIAGTDVVFVETEPSSGSGRLWAIDAATGALYPGWATNPIILDVSAKNGPSTDGTNLYVGTALTTNTSPGSLYSIVAATGAINWQYVEPNGEAWPSGVSVEGDFLYGASRGGTTTAPVGHRYKIDKSGASPVVVWSSPQSASLYGTPTIGRKFVYFPIDASAGIVQVSKDLGLAARNFAASDDICDITMGAVPCIAALSCDGYLFAGDRNSRWWLVNAVTGQYEWFRDFNAPGVAIVNGTALARASSGADYAVVSVRQVGASGIVSAYQLNAGPRPRMIQCVEYVEIAVPFGTLAGNPHSEPDAILNIGNAPLNISGYSISDPAPDGLASIVRDQTRLAASRSRVISRYMNEDGYFGPEAEKAISLVGLKSASVDGEFTAYQTSVLDKYNEALSQTSRTRRMAAGASTIRTSAVTFGGVAAPVAVPAGGSVSVDWLYDGTGLNRGQDLNVIVINHDDPDYNYDGSPTAELGVLYIGGCAFDDDTLHFNTDGSYETVYNHGALGDDGGDNEFFWGSDPSWNPAAFYDGSLFLAGDSVAGLAIPDGGAQMFTECYGTFDLYVPNVSPYSGTCGVDLLTNQLLGARRDGGCPGTPVGIYGEKAYVEFVDSNLAATAGTPGAAIGLRIQQTEVGAYDPLYGDFKLIHYKVINRDAVAKGPIHPATFIDWDLGGGSNTGIVSDAFNGYAMWEPADPTTAYGLLDPNQRSLYSTVDPSQNSPFRITVGSNPTRVYSGAPWGLADDDNRQKVWSELVHETPFRIVDAGMPQDAHGVLANQPFSLAPNGIAEFDQAVFGVDASSDNGAVIEANAVAVAKRAARWAGFARGDVNDDGFVDLADVAWIQCYLGGFVPLYPDTYCGDVNNSGAVDGADVTQLLSFVSGNMGSQPVGAWRF